MLPPRVSISVAICSAVRVGVLVGHVPEEQAALQKSAAAVKELVDIIKVKV